MLALCSEIVYSSLSLRTILTHFFKAIDKSERCLGIFYNFFYWAVKVIFK